MKYMDYIFVSWNTIQHTENNIRWLLQPEAYVSFEVTLYKHSASGNMERPYQEGCFIPYSRVPLETAEIVKGRIQLNWQNWAGGSVCALLKVIKGEKMSSYGTMWYLHDRD